MNLPKSTLNNRDLLFSFLYCTSDVSSTKTLVDPINHIYETSSECSIFFEVDGPYRAMILPAAKEKGKKLKKRYAVFNLNGTLAELKGFEIKRRGELQLIKLFQSEIFERFLNGSTLSECYLSAAEVANRWVDIIDTKGGTLSDQQLLELVTESSKMSKTFEEYGKQKSSRITSAKRLSEMLDNQVQEKGLACSFVVSQFPERAPVSERIIPAALFSASESTRKIFLKKWLKSSTLEDLSLREVLDWSYYRERLNSTIQKILTIPAHLQKLPNPVPRVPFPDWVDEKLKRQKDFSSQARMNEIFQLQSKEQTQRDIEDIGKKLFPQGVTKMPMAHTKKNRGPAPMPLSLPRLEGEDDVSLTARRLNIPKEEVTATDITIQNLKEKWRIKFAEKSAQKSALSKENTYWQIISVEETSPGILKLWCLVGTEMRPIKVRVPRKFYLNCRYESKELVQTPNVKKVNLNLPRSKVSFFQPQQVWNYLTRCIKKKKKIAKIPSLRIFN